MSFWKYGSMNYFDKLISFYWLNGGFLRIRRKVRGKVGKRLECGSLGVGWSWEKGFEEGGFMEYFYGSK